MDRVCNNKYFKKFLEFIKSDIFFLIIYTIFVCMYRLDVTMLKLEHPFLVGFIKNMKEYCYMLFLIRLLFLIPTYINKSTIKKIKELHFFQKIILLLVFFLFLGVLRNYNNTKTNTLRYFFVMILSGINVSFDKITDIFRKVSFIFIISLIFLSVTGLTENYAILRNGRLVYSLGFVYPSNMATAFLIYSVLYVYKKDFSPSLLEMGIMEVFFVASFMINDSRTQFIIGQVLIVFCLCKYFGLVDKYRLILLKIEKFFVVMFPLYSLGSLFVSVFYPYSKIIQRLSVILSNRIELVYYNMQQHGIPFFGKRIQFLGYGANDVNQLAKHTYNYVDNAYMRIMFEWGIVILALLMIMLYIVIIYLYINQKNKQLLLCYIFLTFSLINPILVNFRVPTIYFMVLPNLLLIIKENKLLKEYWQNFKESI